MKTHLQNYTLELFNKKVKDCDDKEIYEALLSLSLAEIKKQELIKGNKKVYYISSEFLIGKLLSNNLINLGIYDSIKQELHEEGKDLLKVEEFEKEPSIGNGGLGRLAACFIDSIATLGLQCDGITLNYHFGLFKQKFEDGLQKEYPNPWLTSGSWQNETDITFEVPFSNFTLTSKMFEIDVLGHNGGKNKLKMFDVTTVDESLVTDGITFDKTDIEKNLTLFLYPDDSDKNGHLLRIYQQYFMVSNSAQLVIKEAKENGNELTKLHEHAVVQINDTHPALVIPELIRLLQLEGLAFEQAVEVVTKTTAYTNHTILAEALEKWPLDYLEEVVPHLVGIIKQLNDLVCQKAIDEKLHIVDHQGRVHMAHMCIHFGFSVNGVAALHTEILKESELKDFYHLYPGKFNNKTNGITFRRWLMHANPELTSVIENLIGDEFKKDANELEKLLAYTDDQKVLSDLLDVKAIKKQQLAKYLKETQNIEIDPTSIIDIQVKRLHEYKRQQMNLLYIINKYLEIKDGKIPTNKITFVFGAKAAPAYTIAKDIIHALLTIGKIIDSDPVVSKYIKVVFVENYNVTEAQYLFPAADVSEQISLASKEASGTGNMKFMLNGAITLGTSDGANVEIHELVGDDNIFTFGKDSDEIIRLYETAGYSSKELMEQNPLIDTLVNFISSDIMMNNGNEESLNRLHHEIVSKDWFMTLIDLLDYIQVKDECFEAYEDRDRWAKMSLVNTAKSGFFSSDRTINDYNQDIWRLT